MEYLVNSIVIIAINLTELKIWNNVKLRYDDVYIKCKFEL